MATHDIRRLCQAVLPPGFEQARRLLPQVQAFLDENLPESVRQRVTVLSIDAQHVVIAANTPLVTNYLRLHAGGDHPDLHPLGPALHRPEVADNGGGVEIHPRARVIDQNNLIAGPGMGGDIRTEERRRIATTVIVSKLTQRLPEDHVEGMFGVKSQSASG